MNFMASGRSALIILAGFWLCLAGPVCAQESDQDTTANSASDANTDNSDAAAVPAKPVKHRAKKPATVQLHPPAKMASKSLNGRKADDVQALQDDPSTSGIPSSVSNAKAQLGAGGSLTDSALKSMSAQADSMMKTVGQGDLVNQPADAPATNGQMVAPDQVNDVDRTMSQDSAPAPTLSMAVAPMPSSASMSNVDSTWGRTSLIGKVFVAVGGLLTLASAARMFIA